MNQSIGNTPNNIKKEFSKTPRQSMYQSNYQPCNAVYPKKPSKRIAKCKSLKPNNWNQTYPDNNDIGIRLYRKGLASKVDIEEKKGKMTLEGSLNMVKKIAKLNDDWDYRLEEDIKKQKEKRIIEKELFEDSIKKQCTFQPEIDKNSSRLARKSKSLAPEREDISEEDSTLKLVNVFQALYLKSHQQNEVNNQVKTEAKKFGFQPKIKSNYQYKTKADYIKQPVTTRLIEAKSVYEEKIKKAKDDKDMKESTIDLKTGQKLYKPKISRGPNVPCADSSKSVYERLNQPYVPKKEDTGRKIIQNKPRGYSSKHSEKLLLNARKKKCQELFELLDPDNCGTLSATHICLKYLSSKTLEILEPILISIEKKKLTMNFDLFQSALEPFARKMTLSQINELVEAPKKASNMKIDNFPFVVIFKYINSQKFHKNQLSMPVKREIQTRIL